MLNCKSKRRRQRQYDASLKEAFLHEVSESDRSVLSIIKEYGICERTAYRWVETMSGKSKKSAPLPPKSPERLHHPLSGGSIMANKEDVLNHMCESSLRAEILRLREELSLAELRAEALDLMIDLAERQEGIKIRKKSGAKQS